MEVVEKLFSLQGKTAMVSGASSGLGAFFSELLAGAGAQVVLTARRTDKLQAVVDKITKAGGTAHAIGMDVNDASSVEHAFEALDSLTGRLDILLNNAGIVSKPQKFISQEEESWGAVLDTNLKGAWRVGQQAARRMQTQKAGVIVNTCSVYSHVTGTLVTDYNVSKVAMLQLTKNMALELARSGVRVNALCPGYFYTELNRDNFDTDRGQAYVQRLVPQRLGNLQELAGPLLLLVSDAGSYINGTSLVVDGGSALNPL